jgi:hypothetical protein
MVSNMEFPDRTVVRLADPATRAGLFDAGALESLLTAGYTVDGLTGPFSPVFDEVRFGLPIPTPVHVDGTWATVGDSKPTELRLTASGLGNDSVRIEAFWRGGIVARFSPAGDPITEVFTAWPDLALIDQMVVAALGNLPNGPVAREKARRTQLRVLARTGIAGNDPLTAADVDAWLARAGVESVADLLARSNVEPTGMVRVTFAAPPPVTPTPRLVPVTVALLVRDANVSISALLADTRRVRERLELAGVEPSARPGLPVRVPIIVGWVLPDAVFDDEDWPGATQAMTAAQRRVARRSAADAWLTREGVGLVAVTS